LLRAEARASAFAKAMADETGEGDFGCGG
jgi:hypothetical protein